MYRSPMASPSIFFSRITEPRPIDRIMLPVQRFLRIEAAGGIMLLGCTVLALLWALYRLGPPVPFERYLSSAAIATAIIVVMTGVAALLIPAFGSNTLAALGAVGVVLIWLYALGFVVIVVPAFISPAEAIIRGTRA